MNNKEIFGKITLTFKKFNILNDTFQPHRGPYQSQENTQTAGKRMLVFVFVLMGWSLLPGALRSFEIYCAPLNLGIRI